MDLYDRLLKLRLVVARVGEMDLARWWNTRGQLGKFGGAALSRGFPRTHHFAQARSVFAVAAHRCAELFSPPSTVNLWNLPAEIEEEFDARWEHWLDHAGDWAPFFGRLQAVTGVDLLEHLRGFELLTNDDLDAYNRLRRSAEGRAVALPQPFSANASTITQLATGFARGEPGAPAVPYARLPS